MCMGKRGTSFQFVNESKNKLEDVEYFSANDVHQLIRMLYKKDKEVERLRSTLMEIATKYNIPVDDIDEL